MGHAHPIKGLGEIALQVRDLEAMTAFYRDIVKLPVLRRFETSTFFRIAEGVAGHTQVLALFDRRGSEGYRPAATGRRIPPLDHIAFAIERTDFEREQARLQALGCEVRTAVHEWVGWRSLYVDDPEGNVVEWVCYDPAIAG